MKPRKTILFYASFPRRSRDTESTMVAFKNKGHRVLFLNQHHNAEFAKELRSKGIETFEFVPGASTGWWRHIKNIFYLVNFSWKHNVNIIFSHLEPASFIAVLAQYLIRAHVHVCRHHSDLYRLMKKDRDFSYGLIYRLANSVVVVSNKAKEHMVKV